MMLPILISVSVAPVSYFFCATADTEAAAMISMESPSVMRSLAQRFIEFSFQRVLRKSGYGFCEQSTRALLEFSISCGVTAFVGRLALLLFRDGRTIAGVRACRKLAGSSS